MQTLLVIGPALVAATVSGLVTPLTTRLARWFGAVDRPGPRKVHHTPVPRLGGLAVVGAIFAGWSVMFLSGRVEGSPFTFDRMLGIILGLLPVLLISLADDVRSVKVTYRLLSQVLGASIAVAFGIALGPEVHIFSQPISLGPLAIPISILWIVGVTNAFNLADGLDGLSAGLGLISALSLAAIGAVASGIESAIAPAVVVGALLGFLPHNLYPARVFLGDAGATSIGFSLACLALASSGRLSSGLAVLVPVLVMGVPVAETLVSIARRLLRRAGRLGPGGVFEADGDHFHHRLLAKGLDQRRATLLLWAAGVGGAGVGLASMFVTARNAALLLVTLLVGAFVSLQRLGYDEFALVRRGVLLRLYDNPVLKLNVFRVFVDLAAVAVSLYLASGLKHDQWSLRAFQESDTELAAVLGLCTVGALLLFGIYKRSWRAASVEDVVRVGTAVVLASVVGFLLATLFGIDDVSFGLFGTYVFVVTVAVAGIRSSYRILDYLRARGQANGRHKVLLYGAGAAGQLALAEVVANGTLGLEPVGFIDDDPGKRGRYVQGYPVLGSIDQLAQILVDLGITSLIVTTRHIPENTVAKIAQLCTPLGISVRRFEIRLEDVVDAGPKAQGLPGAIGAAETAVSNPS